MPEIQTQEWISDPHFNVQVAQVHDHCSSVCLESRHNLFHSLRIVSVADLVAISCFIHGYQKDRIKLNLLTSEGQPRLELVNQYVFCLLTADDF